MEKARIADSGVSKIPMHFTNLLCMALE